MQMAKVRRAFFVATVCVSALRCTAFMSANIRGANVKGTNIKKLLELSVATDTANPSPRQDARKKPFTEDSALLIEVFHLFFHAQSPSHLVELLERQNGAQTHESDYFRFLFVFVFTRAMCIDVEACSHSIHALARACALFQERIRLNMGNRLEGLSSTQAEGKMSSR